MSDPLFQLGLIADVQYADLDNGNTEGRCQRYREAPGKLKEALSKLRQLPLEAVVHLGDIINGGATEKASINELNLIADIFDTELQSTAIPVVHVIGNHCLSSGREILFERLKIPQPGYYTVQLPHNWRLIVLDTTEMSGHSCFSENSSQWAEAREFEKLHPLSEEEPQMSSWNGGITKSQMQWFKNELEKAEKAGERVIVASHHQFGGGAACRATHKAWNAKEIEEVCLEASAAFRLALAGHDHMGGYSSVGGTKHFVTLEALLEAPGGSNAYAVLKVYDEKIVIEGVGTVTSRELAV